MKYMSGHEDEVKFNLAGYSQSWFEYRFLTTSSCDKTWPIQDQLSEIHPANVLCESTNPVLLHSIHSLSQHH